MASEPVLQVELNVIGQELSYNGIPKPIPQTYWTDTLVPLMYPTWAVSYTHLTLPTKRIV